ncbi:hypothetical protein, partial [Escherichia coli]|uniref:hypothetical protein n=1 Tax=Escherichia coli TaxID=562 RepID=UPI0035B63284
TIAIFSCVVRRLRFSGPKTSIICSPMTSLKTSIKTITYLSDTGCLEIQGASLKTTKVTAKQLLVKVYHPLY